MNRLTEGKISTTILKFALPFMVASLLQALYGAADLLVVGQYADSGAVSGVAVGSQVMQTITGIILGISMGGTVLIGRCVGEKNEEGTARAIGTLAALFSIFALILTPIMVFGTNLSVTWMQTPTEAVDSARKYIFVCALGIPFIIGYNAVSGIFRGLGDSKTPVYFIAIACVVNIAVDFVLVGGLKMGALGAAIATVAAQAISFFAALLYLCKNGFVFEFHRRHIHLDRQSASYIGKVGFPLALQDALVNVSFLIITAIINTLGLVASASVGVVEKIIVFAFLPTSAFASAVSAMTAQNQGASKPERALKSMQFGIGYSLVIAVAICTFSQFFAEVLTGIFTNDRYVIISAAQYLRSYSIDCVLVSFVFCMNAYFSGSGNSMISMLHSMIATFCVRIPISYLLSRQSDITLFQLGFAAPLASILSIMICTGYFIWIKNYKFKKEIVIIINTNI